MSFPRIVSADEWLAERRELLATEEQVANALANVRERRRELAAGCCCGHRRPGDGSPSA